MNSIDGTTTLGSFLEVHNFSYIKMIQLTNNVPLPRQDGKHKSSGERDESDRKKLQEDNLGGPSSPVSFRLKCGNATFFPVKRRQRCSFFS